MTLTRPETCARTYPRFRSLCSESTQRFSAVMNLDQPLDTVPFRPRLLLSLGVFRGRFRWLLLRLDRGQFRQRVH